MADPTFDPNQPFQTVGGNPAFDPTQPFQTEGEAPQTSGVEATALGAVKGATAGFAPQIGGAFVSSGLEAELPYLSDEQIAAIQKAGGIKGAGEATKKSIQQTTKQAQEEHPYLFGTGELGGAAGTMFMAPEARAAGLIPKIVQGAKVGAGYGAASGAGEAANAPDSTWAGIGTGAVTGGLEGAIGGAGGTLGGEALGKVGQVAHDVFGNRIAGLYRGYMDPAGEAARRAAGAIIRDQPNVAAGNDVGLTAQEWMAQHQAGQPVIAADLGGETTRALLRSAANSDPEGRAAINNVIQDRFHTQGERLGNEIRQLTGGADATATHDMLQSAYDATRNGLYKKAYQDGDQPIMTPQLERLMGSPAVVGAMKSAITQGQDRAIAQGMGAFNPGVNITPDGRILFNSGKSGVPIYPNLQFWDYTYRALRDQAQAAMRAGRNSEGSALQNLASSMRNELDQQVPSYGQARGVAAQFFGGQDALEAGQKAVNFKGDPKLVAQQVSKMSPAEKALFQEGYASGLAQKLESSNDRNDASRMLYQSPQERSKMQAVFGPKIGGLIEPMLNREKVFNVVRNAAGGNSTTARQLLEAGLAGGSVGGFLGGYEGHGSLKEIGRGFLMGAGAASSLPLAGKALSHTVAGYIDRNVARNVAKYLTSDDPNDIIRGLQMARNNPKIGEALRRLATQLSRTGGIQQSPALPLPSPGAVVYGQGNQQNVPGSPPQQNTGGKVGKPKGFAAGGQVFTSLEDAGLANAAAKAISMPSAVDIQTPSVNQKLQGFKDGGAAKSTKQEADYRGGTKPRHCGICVMFRPPHGCTAVKGKISPHAVCKFFKKKELRAEGGVLEPALNPMDPEGQQPPAPTPEMQHEDVGLHNAEETGLVSAVQGIHQDLQDLGAAPGIKAYHGSPYDFERFDASKIGTGEGAQAYGHGLYFAENPGVAESYKNALQKNLDWTSTEPAKAPPGKMYQVNIAADPSHFLDWDKPLSQQPEVSAAIAKSQLPQHVKNNLQGLTGQEFYMDMAKNAGPNDFIPNGPQRSWALSQAGIPGIKYLDQGSRIGGNGTHNYVVFDPNLINIEKKYQRGGSISGNREISIIRHGATALNNDDVSTDRIRGWKDIPLSAEGHQEAKRLSDKLADNPPDIIFSSDLKRARDTAKAIAKKTGTRLIISSAFRPWDVGKLAGQKSSKAVPILAEYATKNPDTRVPGGESFNDFKKRFLSGLYAVFSQYNGHPAIVTHHRGERLMKAWQAEGFPADGSVNPQVFTQKGEHTGAITEMSIPMDKLMKENFSNPEAQQQLYRLLNGFDGTKSGLKINRKFEVPYLAGSSNDDKTVYIDRRVPKTLAVKTKDGKYKQIDPAEFLAAHEHAEHEAMNKGKSYELAHAEDGTPAERALVEKSGLDWDNYEKVMDGLLTHIEHEHPKRPPPDLYDKPYSHSKRLLLERLEKKRGKQS